MTFPLLRRLWLPPLIEREMRVASRRWTTYWTRVTLLLLTLAPVVPFYVMGTVGIVPLTLGPRLLSVQAGILLFWVVVGAVQMASDAISLEKREGTLGLLFLSGLTPFDVVAGKLAAASLRTGHGLLAVIPALGMSVLIGGVTLGDCVRLAVLLADALFVALACTLVVSSLCRREFQASGWSVVPLGALLGGIPLLNSAGLTHPALDLLNLANPAMALQTFSGLGYQSAPSRFWAQIAAVHSVGWLLVGLACVILPRVWQDRPSTGRRGGWREFYRQWLLGGAGPRARFRREALGRNPMLWHCSREQRARWFPWIFLIAFVAGAAGLFLRRPGDISLGIQELLFLGWSVQIFYKHWVASAASRTYARDREQGGLELVLCTPMSDRQLVAGPLLALRRRFLGPVAAILILQILLAVPAVADSAARDVTELGLWRMLFVLNLVLFPLDLAAVAVVGLWKGVVSKNASQAMSGTNWWVLLMPWICTMSSAVVALSGAARVRSEDVFLMLFVFSLIFDAGALTWAWTRLNRGLRATMLDRFVGGEPWLAGWRWLGRRIAALLSGLAPARGRD